MKKKILSLIISTLVAPAVMFPISICNSDVNVKETESFSVKETNFYTKEGVFERYTYTKEYQNGNILEGNGITVTLEDGNIYELIDSTEWNHIPNGSNVVVTLYNNGTPQLVVDDSIHNIILKK